MEPSIYGIKCARNRNINVVVLFIFIIPNLSCLFFDTLQHLSGETSKIFGGAIKPVAGFPVTVAKTKTLVSGFGSNIAFPVAHGAVERSSILPLFQNKTIKTSDGSEMCELITVLSPGPLYSIPAVR
jgi:hypothetical protein